LEKITIKEVAIEAGVSVSTVSRVISNPGKVKKSNVEAVQNAIKKLNYTPSIAAQSLNKKLNNIGVILSQSGEDSFFSPYLLEVLRGIMNITQKEGYFIQLLSSNRKDESIDELINFHRSGRIDGFIVLSVEKNDRLIDEFVKHSVPFIVNGNAIDREECENVFTVDTDNVEDSFLAVSYLIRLGHKEIAMVNSSRNYIVNYERMMGYRKALETNGLEFKEEYVLETSEKFDDTKEEIRKFMLNNQRVSALFCKNDVKARLAIKVIEEIGLKVPENISIMGHNKSFIANIAYPEITSVQVPIYEMGKKLAENLIKIVLKEEVNRREILPTKLSLKNSCGKTKK